MIEIELIIFVVIVIAVLLFMHFRKKAKLEASVSSVESVSAQTISPEPEPKDEVAIEPEIEANVKEPKAEEVIEASDAVNPIPEDSALRRHYLQNLSSQEDSFVEDSVAATSAVMVEKGSETSAVEEVAMELSPVSGIPEDSALRRHFIQQLTAEIETTMPQRPTDSTLKRHYDAQLLSSVASKLEALK